MRKPAVRQWDNRKKTAKSRWAASRPYLLEMLLVTNPDAYRSCDDDWLTTDLGHQEPHLALLFPLHAHVRFVLLVLRHLHPLPAPEETMNLLLRHELLRPALLKCRAEERQ